MFSSQLLEYQHMNPKGQGGTFQRYECIRATWPYDLTKRPLNRVWENMDAYAKSERREPGYQGFKEKCFLCVRRFRIGWKRCHRIIITGRKENILSQIRLSMAGHYVVLPFSKNTTHWRTDTKRKKVSPTFQARYQGHLQEGVALHHVLNLSKNDENKA